MEHDARLVRLETTVEQIGKALNGPPSLEQKMREYADSRDNHKAASASQAMVNLSVLIGKLDAKQDELALKQDRRHEQNTDKFNAISVKIAWGSGAFAVIVILVQHYWK